MPFFKFRGKKKKTSKNGNSRISLPEGRHNTMIHVLDPKHSGVRILTQNENNRQSKDYERRSRQRTQEQQTRKRKLRMPKMHTPKLLKQLGKRTKKKFQGIGNKIGNMRTRRKVHEDLNRTDSPNSEFNNSKINFNNLKPIGMKRNITFNNIKKPTCIYNNKENKKENKKKNKMKEEKRKQHNEFKIIAFENPLYLTNEERINSIKEQIINYQPFIDLVKKISVESHYLNNANNQNQDKQLINLGAKQSLLLKLLRGEKINRNIETIINPTRLFKKISKPEQEWTPDTITIYSMTKYTIKGRTMFSTTQQLEKVFIAILLSPDKAFLDYEDEFEMTSLRTIYNSLYKTLTNPKNLDDNYLKEITTNQESLLYYFIDVFNSNTKTNIKTGSLLN